MTLPARSTAWSSDGPASLADAAFTGLTDEVDADAGGAKVLDVQVSAKVTTGAGSPATQSHVAIWAATPADDSNYGGSANWVLVGVCFAPTAATAAWSPKFSLAAAFGGALPKLFKLALENGTGLALAAGADDTEVYITRQHANVQAS
jgi:hypothetical protein